MHNDDVDFVEQSVLQALNVNDPVYIVGLQYYTTRKKSQTLRGVTVDRTMANGLGGQKTCTLVPGNIQGEGLFIYAKTPGRTELDYWFLAFRAPFQFMY